MEIFQNTWMSHFKKFTKVLVKSFFESQYLLRPRFLLVCSGETVEGRQIPYGRLQHLPARSLPSCLLLCDHSAGLLLAELNMFYQNVWICVDCQKYRVILLASHFHLLLLIYFTECVSPTHPGERGTRIHLITLLIPLTTAKASAGFLFWEKLEWKHSLAVIRTNLESWLYFSMTWFYYILSSLKPAFSFRKHICHIYHFLLCVWVLSLPSVAPPTFSNSLDSHEWSETRFCMNEMKWHSPLLRQPCFYLFLLTF